MIYVLDSSVMIAWLADEPGADRVDAILRDIDGTCLAHNINLCEVFYDAMRRGNFAAAESAVADLLSMQIGARSDFDEAFWKQVGELKARHRASLADLCAVALALRVGGVLLTSDHHEFDRLAAANVCSVEFIR